MSNLNAKQLVARMLEYSLEPGYESPDDSEPNKRAASAKPMKFKSSDFLGKRGHDDMEPQPGVDDEDEEPHKPNVIPRFKWRPPNPPEP